MDERLEKALVFANYRITILNRRKAIQRRFDTMSIMYFNNGKFIANSNTISFITALLTAGHKSAVVIDVESAPIEIDSLQEFLDKLINLYFNATNELLAETKRLTKARNIKKVMDW